MLTFHVISLFPDTVRAYCDESILKKAQESKKIEIQYYNLLDYSDPSVTGKLDKRIDDKPYAGGPGMVIRAEVVIKAIKRAVGRKRNVGFIHCAPRSEYFTTHMAHSIAQESLQKNKPIKDIVIICGRYEGIDSRIIEMYPGRTVSIGDYVLTGGEIPAMVVIDSVSRQIPGVLGDFDSREESRDAAGKYYTRPERITHKKKHYDVPRVLLSGDHKKIEEWRKNNL